MGEAYRDGERKEEKKKKRMEGLIEWDLLQEERHGGDDHHSLGCESGWFECLSLLLSAGWVTSRRV